MPFMLIVFLLPATLGFNSDYIAEYFSYKDVRYVSILHCNTLTSQVLSANIMSKNMRVQTLSIKVEIKPEYLRASLNYRLTPIGVWLDSQCLYSSSVLRLASQMELFRSTHMWLVSAPTLCGNVTENSGKIYIYENFANLNLSVDTDIAVAILKDNEQYELVDVFNFGKIQGNPLEKNSLGKWSNETGLEMCLKRFKYYNRWDFHNLTLRAITVVLGKARETFTPSVLTDISYTKGVSPMTKITSIVLNILQEKHNFRLNYTVTDRWVGPPMKNSSLAVTNSMHWKQQDISSTCLRIFPHWLDWMDPFFPPVTFLETKFYYRIPSTGVGDYENRFLQPLSPTVWWCALLAFSVCAATLALGAYFEQRAGPISYAVFSVTAAACQQDFTEGEELSTSFSSQGRRMILFVIGCSSMILYNYYTSSVVSWLLNAAPPAIAGMDGLIGSNLELVFEDIGYTRSWLESPGFYYYKGYTWPKEDELREKKVIKGRRTVNLLQSIEDGIELVRKGGFAYHTEPYNANLRVGRTFDERTLCELGALQMMSPSQVFMVGQRRSPYKQFFTWSMLRLSERGHLAYARRRMMGATPRCAGSTPRALSLGQAAPAFAALAYGCLVSVFILVCEILSHRRHADKNWVLQKKRENTSA